jgi:Flp pilus assembly protein TadG
MRSRKNQRGQALIESGLVMLVFLPVFIGIMDFGQFLYLNQTLWERLRVAARYGATVTYTDGSDIVNMAIYNDPAPGAGAAATLPNMQGSDSTADGYVTATLSAADADGNKRVVVTVTHYPYNFLMMPSNKNFRTVVDTEPYEGP